MDAPQAGRKSDCKTVPVVLGLRAEQHGQGGSVLAGVCATVYPRICKVLSQTVLTLLGGTADSVGKKLAGQASRKSLAMISATRCR